MVKKCICFGWAMKKENRGSRHACCRRCSCRHFPLPCLPCRPVLPTPSRHGLREEPLAPSRGLGVSRVPQEPPIPHKTLHTHTPSHHHTITHTHTHTITHTICRFPCAFFCSAICFFLEGRVRNYPVDRCRPPYHDRWTVLGPGRREMFGSIDELLQYYTRE